MTEHSDCADAHGHSGHQKKKKKFKVQTKLIQLKNFKIKKNKPFILLSPES